MLAFIKKGTLPLKVLVRAMAERPSEIFGLNKGRIECGTFVRNLNTLSEYLEMAGSAPAGK